MPSYGKSFQMAKDVKQKTFKKYTVLAKISPSMSVSERQGSKAIDTQQNNQEG